MRSSIVMRYGLILSLILLAFTSGKSAAAPNLQDSIWIITGPAEGSTVSGEIAIVGTGTHPNFESYKVLYAPGPRAVGDSAWVFLTAAEGVKNMVINGTLTTWDTTTVPNGVYTLALALYEVGNTEPKLHFTNNITVFNEQTTPTPEPTPTPSEAETPTPGNTLEPIEAPTIEQPPTATPQPTPTLAPISDGNGSDAGGDGAFDPAQFLSVDAIKEAAKTGIQLAFLIYAVGLLYSAAKAVIRYYLRQMRKRPGS
ncbi:MAG: hypothetical protein E4H27_00005 [Anaerolineales bacterium]|nr:MAG: hypothetical protein E4H27_00005 [Anaerolineales bacterium]